MKPTALITCLCLAALPAAFADKPKPLPDAPEIVRPIGRIQPGQGDLEAVQPTEAIPKDYANEKAIAIKLESLVRNNGFYQVKLRIINPTDKPMTFRGFSETSPITKIQHWQDGKWVEERRFLKCGTGLRQCTIAPGQSATFGASVEGDKLPTRIGIAYTNVPRLEGSPQPVVWSEKIER